MVAFSFFSDRGRSGNARKFIDGQLYGVAYSWGRWTMIPNFPPDPNGFVNRVGFRLLSKGAGLEKYPTPSCSSIAKTLSVHGQYFQA